MVKFNLFRADVVVKNNIGSDAEHAALLDQILKDKNKNQSLEFSNELCWRGQSMYKNIDWLILEIKNSLKEFSQDYAEEFKSKNLDFNKIKYHYWTNVNQTGSRNTRHAHPKAHFSAVYYVQANDTGAIRFINPGNDLGYCNPRAPFVTDVGYAPSDRDLIVWPSWVPHEVETNFSNKDRINVTFDIILG